MFYTLTSSYYLFKLINKRNLKESERKPCENVGGSPLLKCRICLKPGSVPIYGDDRSPDISSAVKTLADIQLDKNDNFPKYLCSMCFNVLKEAVIFQRKAKESELILQNSFKQKCEYQSTSSNNFMKGNSSAHNYSQTQSISNYEDEIHDSLSYNENLSSPPPSPSISDNFSCVTSENESDLEKCKYLSHRKKSCPLSRVRCKLCRKVMLKGSAKNHLDIHSDTKKYVCEICGKSYSQKSAYYTHSFTHNKVFKFKCKFCQYRSNTAANLKSHMRTHTRDYKYLCSECPKRFLTKSNLNKHLLTHKSRGFKCELCEKSYYGKRQLLTHVDVVHLGIKSHICNLCGKAFGYRKRMLDHQLQVHKRKKMKEGRMPLYLRLNPETEMQERIQIPENEVLLDVAHL